MKMKYTSPPRARRVKNYTILDLNGNFVVVRERWLNAVYDLRSWVFNSTNQRFKFGDIYRCSSMTPPDGHFFIYLHYNGKWMCMVIDGPTLYLIGFITSSCGPEGDLHVHEMFTPSDPMRHNIENSKHMAWQGNYFDVANIAVGGLALVNSFCGMYKYASNAKPRPSKLQVKKWCDVFVSHFPEAGRLDCLLLCAIYCQFVTGGKAGTPQMSKAQHWSGDSRFAMQRVTEGTPDEMNDNKGSHKGKNKVKGKSKMSAAAEKINLKTKESRQLSRTVDKAEGKSESGTVDETVDETLEHIISNIRIFHRPEADAGADAGVVYLSDLPIQLSLGRPVSHVPKVSEEKEFSYLVAPFGNRPHNCCGYFNGQWICKRAGSTSGAKNGVLSPTGKEDDKKGVASTPHDQHSASADPPLEREVKKGTCKDACSAPGDKNGASSALGEECDEKSAVSTTENDVKEGQRAGLKNLGNTCYLNSTLQCLYSVPELTKALSSYSNSEKCKEVDEDTHNLTLAACETYTELNQSVKPVAPKLCIQMLRKRNKQFDEIENGVYAPQDAEECWLELLDTFDKTLVSESCKSSALMMKELFTINLKTSIHCEGISEDPPKFESERSLKCIISEDVNNFDDGFMLNLKNTETESKIHELPRYLTIKFVRDNWDKKSNGIKRTLKRVEYPAVFDISKYCSDELKDTLKMNVGSPISSTDKDVSSVPEQFNGIYDLICVLTYGGDAKLGHYIAWIKGEDGKWSCYNDDIFSMHEEREVLELCGGGASDSQMAYICLYKGQMV